MWLWILRLLIALPSIWSMISEIIDLIRALPKSEQPEAKARLLKLAKEAKAVNYKGTQSPDIRQFKDELLRRLGRSGS
jgi:hypothetical protein